jgi:taurine dioxygenase
MALENIVVTRMAGAIGAYVEGIDLTDLSHDEWQLVQDLFTEHQVLTFRDQNFTPESQIAFGKRWGGLHVHPAAPSPEGFPEILVIKADENSKFVAGNAWHTDVSCEVEPPSISMLYMMETPPAGGDTLFSSMYAAYDALPEDIKTAIEGKRALHSSAHIYAGRYNIGPNDSTRGEYPENYHPMVTLHPVTGRKVIFVNQGFTQSIEGMSEEESSRLLRRIYEIQARPEFTCRVHWQPGSLTMWDNRCTHHYAIWDYFPHKRRGHRVTIQGSVPIPA